MRKTTMRELSYAEVQEISGGIPPASSLDDATYRMPAEQLFDPVDYEHTVAPAAPRTLPL
jgi:hypothetical protein